MSLSNLQHNLCASRRQIWKGAAPHSPSAVRVAMCTCDHSAIFMQLEMNLDPTMRPALNIRTARTAPQTLHAILYRLRTHAKQRCRCAPQQLKASPSHLLFNNRQHGHAPMHDRMPSGMKRALPRLRARYTTAAP